MSNGDREDEAFDIRQEAAQLAKDRRCSPHPRNGEERDYHNRFIANYSKD